MIYEKKLNIGKRSLGNLSKVTEVRGDIIVYSMSTLDELKCIRGDLVVRAEFFAPELENIEGKLVLHKKFISPKLKNIGRIAFINAEFLPPILETVGGERHGYMCVDIPGKGTLQAYRRRGEIFVRIKNKQYSLQDFAKKNAHIYSWVVSKVERLMA